MKQKWIESASEREEFESNLSKLSSKLVKVRYSYSNLNKKLALTLTLFLQANESLAILYSKVFDSSSCTFSLTELLNSNADSVGSTFKALRKLLCSKEEPGAGNTLKKGEGDIEMLDESENKNGSQARNFAEEIENNLCELMTKFVAAYKEI